MLTWWRDVRLAGRALAQRPTFTVTVVLTLALGVGTTAAILAIVDSTLIRPLPYPESDRIVWIRHHLPGMQLPELENSPGTLFLYEQHARSFSALAAVTEGQRNLTGGPEPARIHVLQTTASLFDVLRVPPRLGRALVEDDGRPGATPVAVLTHAAWTTYFGNAPDIIGRTVLLDDVATEIVGVMPAGFSYPTPETAALLPENPDIREGFGSFGIGGMARLGPGVALADAQRELTLLQDRIPELFPEVPVGFLREMDWHVSVQSLRDVTVEGARTALWVVLGTVGFLLLAACVSVANLFLVRAEARQRDIGIRMALGAGRGRIAVTFLHESVLVGIAGGVCGVLAAMFTVRALVAAGPVQLPRLAEISVNSTVLAFAALVSVGAGIFFGLLPLVRQVPQPLSGLVGSSRGHTAGRERHRIRKALIVTQIALALMLLTGSGLMLRSFQRLRAVDPGFDADRVITMGISLGGYRTKQEAAQLTHEILEQVRALPSVLSAGATNALPLDRLSDPNFGSFHIRSRPRAEDAVPPVAMYSIATDGLHETLRTPLQEGRALTRGDVEEQRQVVTVNEMFARSILGGRAIGELISFGSESEIAWHEIVGVVADVRAAGLREDVHPAVYLPITTPLTGARTTLMQIAARTTTDPAALTPSLRAIVRRVDPSIPLTTVRTMQSITDAALGETAFTMLALSVAALVALLLGAIGLYGVIGYVVTQRTKEIGVRIALGAVPASVRLMVLRQGLVLAGAGSAIGMAGAVMLSRGLDSVLFEVDGHDPATLLAVTVVLLGVSAVSTYVPARRAAVVSPIEALRAE